MHVSFSFIPLTVEALSWRIIPADPTFAGHRWDKQRKVQENALTSGTNAASRMAPMQASSSVTWPIAIIQQPAAKRQHETIKATERSKPMHGPAKAIRTTSSELMVLEANKDSSSRAAGTVAMSNRLRAKLGPSSPAGLAFFEASALAAVSRQLRNSR